MPTSPAAATRARSRSKYAWSKVDRSNLGLPSVAVPGPILARGLGPHVLPAPEPDEVVPVFSQEGQVGVVVELLRGARAIRAGTHAVVEIVPDVRARQEH